MMSTAQSTDLMASALAAGLVTAREVADGVVGVRGTALELHGRPIAYARSGQLALRELRCLRLLTETELVPAVLRGEIPASGNAPGGSGAPASSQTQASSVVGEICWTEAVRGTPLTELRGTMAELADACQAWGAALAALHQTRIESGTEPPLAVRPWVLDPDRLPRGMRQAPSGSARAYVVRTLRSDRGLLRTAARAADRWSADHWTHADLTGDRVVVQRVPDLRVRFVDLHAAGLGDPAWDLAGALDTIAELTGSRAPWGSSSGACLSDYLLQGYRRAGGTAVVDAGTRALRLVARAWLAAAALDSRAGHPASMHPAAGHSAEASRLTERLTLARELAVRSARPGLVAA